jgi:hypothetical protein
MCSSKRFAFFVAATPTPDTGFTYLTASIVLGGVTASELNQGALTSAIAVAVGVAPDMVTIPNITSVPSTQRRALGGGGSAARALSGGGVLVEFTICGSAPAIKTLAATVATALEAPAFATTYTARSGGQQTITVKSVLVSDSSGGALGNGLGAMPTPAPAPASGGAPAAVPIAVIAGGVGGFIAVAAVTAAVCWNRNRRTVKMPPPARPVADDGGRASTLTGTFVMANVCVCVWIFRLPRSQMCEFCCILLCIGIKHLGQTAGALCVYTHTRPAHITRACNQA